MSEKIPKNNMRETLDESPHVRHSARGVSFSPLWEYVTTRWPFSFLADFRFKRVPLDTITTRFLMVFIFLLAVPLVSVIVFTFSTVQNEVKDSANRQIQLMQDAFRAHLDFKERTLMTLGQGLSKEDRISRLECARKFDKIWIDCLSLETVPVKPGYQWMDGTLWFIAPARFQAQDFRGQQEFPNAIGFPIDESFINRFYQRVPAAWGDIALVPETPATGEASHFDPEKIIPTLKRKDDRSVSSTGDEEIKAEARVVYSQGLTGLAPDRWLKTSLLSKWMDNTTILLPLDKYGDFWLSQFHLYAYDGHKMASIVFLVPSTQQFKLQNYYVGLYILSVSAVVLAVILAMVAGRPITQPLLRLISQMQDIRHSNVRAGLQVVDVHGVYEINQLAQAFNDLLFRLKQEHLMQDEFVATLTHDLKVPMLAEKQTLRYLLNDTYGPLAETQKEILRVIEDTNGESLTLVNGLLEVYRYGSGSASLNMDIFDICPLIRQSISALQSLANEKGITLEVQSSLFSEGLTLMEGSETVVPVYGDALELKRVLQNLVSNAITNTPRYGKIVCRIETAETLKTIVLHKISAFQRTTLRYPILMKGRVLISVQDSGIGFDAEDLPRLFQQFSASRGRNPMSMGLGLFNCHQVVEAHNGSIWVETTEGEGAAVSFVLPQSKEAFSDRRRRDRRRVLESASAYEGIEKETNYN
ncbi:MAG: HAMP domain-containing sensor histidine kinase [Vampirovibrionales bacterium]|nr:HAMP domain-containing sensor histidine kinase [Vampirovibrionales bacterium]